MLTCIVPMQTEQMADKRIKFCRQGPGRRNPGFSLVEQVVVIAIMAMIFAMAMVNLGGLAYRNSFKNQTHELVNVFKKAVTTAGRSSRKYEVILDFTEQEYTLRQISRGLGTIEDVLNEEIILTGSFNREFQLAYVMFDDGETTNDEPAFFRAGRSGWQYGGKVVLLDSEGNEYSIVINRISRMIRLETGDAKIMTPRSPDEMQF